jgi:hypothetical protein
MLLSKRKTVVYDLAMSWVRQCGQCDRNSLVLGKQENVTETAWIMLLGKRKIIMLPKEV